MSSTAVKNAITLKGSSQIITNYLKYGINSILFQRGLYPTETFENDQQYGITLLMSKDPKIQAYLDEVLGQLESWLTRQEVERISMVIKNVAQNEVIECWDFNVNAEIPEAGTNILQPTSSKELKKIQGEIRDVMRQIAATISYLPLLECVCSFDILVYTKTDTEIPAAWKETAGVVMQNPQTVQLKSFSTGIHKVDTIVNYKMTD